jgi:HK97 family phage major capsid protein
MMKTKLSPGRRALLASRGIDPRWVGRICNRATLTPPAGVPVPRNSDELAEMIHDPAKLKDVAKDPATLGGWIQAYAEQQQGDGTDMQRQIAAEVQKQTAEILRGNDIDVTNDNIKRLNLDPQLRGPVSRRHNPKAPGAKLDQKFGNWGDYMSTIWSRNTSMKALEDRAEIQKVQNAFGSTVPSDGGFLIPETLRSELLRVALEMSVVRSRARVIPMETLSVPMPTIDSTSNASSVHGGLVGYWTEEAGALTESAPKFGRVVLTAKKLTIYTEIPNELLQDSLISLTAFMDEAFPDALNFFEDVAFCSGDGVGQPLGFLNAAAAVSVTKETGQAAATILWENIAKCYSRMLPGSLGRAVWIAHIDTFPELATMALSVGTGGSAVWIGSGVGTDGSGTPPVTILGRPVIFTEKASSVGTAGDINFVDLGYYLIGDRQVMQADSSAEFKFGNDKTAFRVIQRVDGRPWIQSAITPQTGTNTLSPFVKIAVRA